MSKVTTKLPCLSQHIAHTHIDTILTTKLPCLSQDIDILTHHVTKNTSFSFLFNLFWQALLYQYCLMKFKKLFWNDIPSFRRAITFSVPLEHCRVKHCLRCYNTYEKVVNYNVDSLVKYTDIHSLPPKKNSPKVLLQLHLKLLCLCALQLQNENSTIAFENGYHIVQKRHFFY